MWPLVEIFVEPRSTDSRDEMVAALKRLAANDPTFEFLIDRVTGQTIMKGRDEPHLNTKVDLLRRIYNIDVSIGRPQVAYREYLGRSADIFYAYERHAGGSDHFAEVRIVFEPGEQDSGFHFASGTGGELPSEFVAGVETGLRQQQEMGLLAGFPVVDFKATLIGGRYRNGCSSSLSFEIAARVAFRELRDKGLPDVREPIMKVEVLAPRRYAAKVRKDLEGRYGDVESCTPNGDADSVSAAVPLARMFGYADVLRTMAQGEAQFTMQFARYRSMQLPAPPDDRFPLAVRLRA